MQQLSEAYDESSDIRRDDNAITQSKKGYRRIILPGAGKFKENLAVSQQVRGGGYSAYWRMTDIWTEQNKNKPLPQAKASARSWFLLHYEILLCSLYQLISRVEVGMTFNSA